ncbi:MAG: phosphatidate cytidylyltransferase [Flavobacteriia bacterium]|nr:MAG: phosphatidate cytidylyltransferase [Flavobacteriia bacterium]
MNNLIKRAISGSIYVSILITGILYNKLTFLLLFLVIMNISLYEFNRMIKLKSVFPFILGNLLFIFGNTLNFSSSARPFTEYAGVALFLGFFATFISILFQKKEEAVAELGKKFLSVVYIALPFTLIVMIPSLNNQFQFINTTILGVFILVWVNDSFAYLVGSMIGKNKLFYSISPNKTWEGFIGGMVFTFGMAFILAHYFEKLDLINWLVLAFIVSTFGVLGDLIESMFKRQAGLKDSGNIIPGHGGMLDRMDSMIFSAPFIFIYLLLIN